MENLRPLTVGEFAKLVGLSVRRVQQLSAEGLIPKSEKGKYEIAEAFPAYLSYLKSTYEGGDDSGYEIYRSRKMRFMAERAEIELKKMRGQLVEIDTIATQVKSEYVYVRQKLLSIPSKAALQLSSINDPIQIQAKLSALINDTLSDMSADEQYAGSGNDNSSERESSENAGGSKEGDSKAGAQTSP